MSSKKNEKYLHEWPICSIFVLEKFEIYILTGRTGSIGILIN